MSGFLMMMTQNGKLLYISDNAAEYLGHSMVIKHFNIQYSYVDHILFSSNSNTKFGNGRNPLVINTSFHLL